MPLKTPTTQPSLNIPIQYDGGLIEYHNNTMKNEIIITARCKAFGRTIKNHELLISDGVVRVWDPVAGYFTTCHSLSRAAERRILRLGRAIEPSATRASV